MRYTTASISLTAIPIDAPENLARLPKDKIVWRWICPACHQDHPGAGETVASADEAATAEDILADPRCHYCRKKPQQELPL
jgi:hypothetical protein